jgi:hypothetical protein
MIFANGSVLEGVWKEDKELIGYATLILDFFPHEMKEISEYSKSS